MNYIKQARLKKELTQTELASLTGLHQSQISLFEKGKAIPTPKQRIALLKALIIVSTRPPDKMPRPTAHRKPDLSDYFKPMRR